MSQSHRRRSWLATLTTIPLLAFAWTGTAEARGNLDEYVALGDSYASGNGTGNPDLDWGCYRSSDAYAAIIDRERPRTTLDFEACGGAVTGDVIDGQTRALSRKTDYVTISIGGNDVGFVNLILSCWSAWDEGSCLSTADSVNERIAGELPTRLDATYADIAARAPGAEVIVVGYPRAFSGDLSCAQANGISAAEATALNGVSDHLDAVIGDRARAAGFTYVSVIDQFTGHDVCANDPYLVGKYAWNISDIYHPTASGHRNGFTPLIRDIIG